MFNFRLCLSGSFGSTPLPSLKPRLGGENLTLSLFATANTVFQLKACLGSQLSQEVSVGQKCRSRRSYRVDLESAVRKTATGQILELLSSSFENTKQ